MNRKIVLALAGSFLLAALNTVQIPSAGAAVASAPSSGTAGLPDAAANELRYPVDLPALRQEFRQTGAVTLPAPLLGEVKISGKENELTSHGNRTQNLPHIHILGSAVGYPNSTANILIGEYGVYGSVEILQPSQGPLVLEFNSVETAPGSFLESVRIRGDEPASRPTHSDAVRFPGLPLQANSTHGPGHVGLPELMAPLSSQETYYYDDDGTMEAEAHMDYTDDWAVKYIYLPPDALKDGTSATASLDGKAEGCGGATNNVFSLWVNNNFVLSFDPCAAWTEGSHRRYTVDIPLAFLYPGFDNGISLSDSSHWTTRNAYFGVDTQNDNGRSDIHQCESGNCPNGDNIAGELMWSLIIRTTNPPPPPPTNECEHPAGATSYTTANPDADAFARTTSSAKEADSPPDPCDETPNCSGGYGISWVTYHAEAGFVNAHSDWRDRILSAQAHYVPMWQLLCISLRAYVVQLGASVLTTSQCDGNNSVKIQYKDWLRNTWFNNIVAFNDDAYQLWTDRDLSDDERGTPGTIYCYGIVYLADQVDITREGFTEGSSSVIEGVDHGIDGYDPNDVHERGIVSGHELAHLYGEEKHPYDCGSYDSRWAHGATECNIMRNCKDPDLRRFFFAPSTKREILFRYHYAEETTSGYEEQPGCPP